MSFGFFGIPLPSVEPTLSLPPPSPLAEEYYRLGNLIWVAAIVWGCLVPAIFLFTGLSARLRARAAPARPGAAAWYRGFALYFWGFWTFLFLLNLPFNYFAGFVREHAYGLSDQTVGKWLWNHAMSYCVGLAGGLSFIWVPYWLLNKAPRRWWLITGLLAIPYFFFVLLIAPVVIDPLFNHFGPMQNRALEAKIVQLARRAGIENAQVYEVNKSVDTKKMNAYVTGFLGTHRMVVWDTLLKELNDDQVVSVMAHEMGHYVLGHVVRGVLLSSVLTLLGLGLIHLLAGQIISRAGPRLGFRELGDFASLPLLMILLQIVSFGITPFGLAYSRHIEHEADRFGLEITHDNLSAMETELKFVTKDLAYPYPSRVIKWLRYSHPPTAERFDFMERYRPWETGQPLRYAKYFREGIGSAAP